MSRKDCNKKSCFASIIYPIKKYGPSCMYSIKTFNGDGVLMIGNNLNMQLTPNVILWIANQSQFVS